MVITTKPPSASYSTTGTVSSPLDLDSLAKSEHETVTLNGSTSTAGKKIRPKPKVTLTSLTVNNVGSIHLIAVRVWIAKLT